MSESIGIWAESYNVNVYDADINGRLKITALCNYIQNTAWLHYREIEKIKGAMLKKGHIWAMIRLEAVIYSTAHWGDCLKVMTWSRNVGKLSAFRDYEVSDSKGKRIAGATSTWVVIEPLTKEIQSLKGVSDKWPEQREQSALGRDAGKAPGVVNPSSSVEFKVRFGEFDVNRHVNNVTYIDWMNESLSRDYLENHELRSMKINFLEEVQYNGHVTVLTEEKAHNSFACSVFNKETGKESARGLFTFSAVTGL